MMVMSPEYTQCWVWNTRLFPVTILQQSRRDKKGQASNLGHWKNSKVARQEDPSSSIPWACTHRKPALHTSCRPLSAPGPGGHCDRWGPRVSPSNWVRTAYFSTAKATEKRMGRQVCVQSCSPGNTITDGG